MESVIQDTQMWTQTNFARAELGDVRRTKRLMILAAQVAADPSASLPEQTGTWNDLRAAYNLFDCEDVTFEAIAAPHWEQTKTTRSEILLILEDTTEIDYSLNRKIKDLSPVGSGTRQGFHLHSGLMVSAEDDRIHGLAGQLIYHRQHISKGETRTERLQRDDRESQIWCKLVDQIGSPPPGSTWVHVVDRGADDFEFFYHCQQTQTEWVVRQEPAPNDHHAQRDSAGAVYLLTYSAGSRLVHTRAAGTPQPAGADREAGGLLWGTEHANASID